MTELEQAKDWARYFEMMGTAHAKFDALCAALNHGEEVLRLTLRELNLTSAADVVMKVNSAH